MIEAIQISEKLAKDNKGVKNGLNIFDYGETKSSIFFCSKESASNHSDVFKGLEINVVKIDPLDVKREILKDAP